VRIRPEDLAGKPGAGERPDRGDQIKEKRHYE